MHIVGIRGDRRAADRRTSAWLQEGLHDVHSVVKCNSLASSWNLVLLFALRDQTSLCLCMVFLLIFPRELLAVLESTGLVVAQLKVTDSA